MSIALSPLQHDELEQLFSGAAHMRQLLRFEAALAKAEARAGVIPTESAEAIAAACHVESFDVAELYASAERSGTIVVPLVRALTARTSAVGAPYVHWGATSQDAIDTALMLQMRDALTILIADVRRVATECARLTQAHRLTMMAGRTLLQQAVPITFGLKAARWLALAVRQERSLRECREQRLALQFGGAAGTLAALGDEGLPVAEFLAAELQLPLPDLPWHAERDRVGGIASTVGVAAGGIAKIASDLVLLSQTEVGEVAESAEEGKGTSSAMAQKRNAVDATAALAAARLCAGAVAVVLGALAQHEHERAAGAWQSESAAIPQLFGYAASTVSRVASALTGLEVDPVRMAENAQRHGGMFMTESLMMELARTLGRTNAQSLTQRLVRDAKTSGRSFADVVRADTQVTGILSPQQIDHALDPTSYLGSAEIFIDRALASFHALQRDTILP